MQLTLNQVQKPLFRHNPQTGQLEPKNETALALVNKPKLEAKAAAIIAQSTPKTLNVDPVGRWRPTECVHEKRTPYGVVFYGTNKNGTPSAIGYAGKSKKSTWYFSFSNEKQFQEKMNRFLEGLEQHELAKVKWRAERAAYDARSEYKAGDIVYNSWGYEQTNIDYYQVLEVSAKFLKLRPIASRMTDSEQSQSMSGRCEPIPDQFTGEAMKRGVSKGGVNFKHGCGSKYDGRPRYCSWYG